MAPGRNRSCTGAETPAPVGACSVGSADEGDSEKPHAGQNRLPSGSGTEQLGQGIGAGTAPSLTSRRPPIPRTFYRSSITVMLPFTVFTATLWAPPFTLPDLRMYLRGLPWL